MQLAAVARNRGEDWRALLDLADQAPDEFLIHRVVIEEAQRQHVEEVQAIADRTARQTANYLAPELGKLIRALAKGMR